MDLNRASDALDTYKDAEALFPDNDLIHYLLGNVYKSAKTISSPKTAKPLLIFFIMASLDY